MRSKSVYTYSDGNVGVLRQFLLLWFSAALGSAVFTTQRPAGTGFSIHRLEDDSTGFSVHQ